MTDFERQNALIDRLNQLLHEHADAVEPLGPPLGHSDDGGKVMLFARLHRGMMNQVTDGSVTVSRYAIWARTGRDRLVEALAHLDGGRERQARELIVGVANALRAFEVLQDEIERDGRQ